MINITENYITKIPDLVEIKDNTVPNTDIKHLETEDQVKNLSYNVDIPTQQLLKSVSKKLENTKDLLPKVTVESSKLSSVS